MPRVSFRRSLLVLAALVLAGCTTTPPERMTTTPEVYSQPWYDRAHHDAGGGFRNAGVPRDVPFFKAAGWILSHTFGKKENVPPPVRPVDAAALQAPPAQLRLTWVGHANLYLQTPRLNLLFDPQFGERASPFSFAGPAREVALPLRPEDLPGVDVVLISHDHYDHLDEGSIRRLQQQFAPLFLVPLGLGEIVRGWGAPRVVELDWWQYVDVGGVRYHCTPARHFSGRGLFNRDGTLWASWYLEDLQGGPRLFYAGDTGYGDHFTEIRERLGAPDVALLPIGAYLPRWFMAPVHVDPEQAVQAFLDLQARHFIPVHWGTFDLADERLQDPPRELRTHAAARGITDRVHLLDVGGRFDLQP